MKSYIVFNGTKPQGESHIHRHRATPNGPVFHPMSNGAKTMYEAFHSACKQYSSSFSLGHRTVSASGAVGVYTFITYKQLQHRVNNFANGLAQLQLQPKTRVGLYSSNRGEWNIAEFACYNFSFIPVPLYDTLGAEAAAHIIAQAEVEVVVASEEKIESLQRIAQQNPQLKAIIVMTRLPYEKKTTATTGGTISSMSSSNSSLRAKIYSFVEIENLGASKPMVAHQPPTPKDVVTLCYTSGTTGVPKGAILTHEGLICNLTSIFLQGLDTAPGDVHISYLPLAHMFERSAFAMNLFHGSTTCYARGDPLLLLDDIVEARPTLFVGVPRLYNRLYDKVLATVEESGALKKWLFHTAYSSKQHQLLHSSKLTSPLFDRLVFSKIREKLGGRVRLFATGSAPISDNVMTFLRIAFSAPVIEGYGQTEATTGVTLTMPFDHSLANVGGPLMCNEVKLVDVPEMSYLSSDTRNGIPHPRGEVCSRGPNTFQGYYKDSEKTAEAVDKDGWLHSGDIGMWLPDGTLKIIDRKKNIFKLSQGEYIAPEKCEQVYMRCKLIAQIFVYGDSLQSCLVAVVVPDEETLVNWAKRTKQSSTHFAALCQSETVKQMIADEMTTVGETAKLAGFEQVKEFTLSHELWTVENDLLTPTMKLKRNVVQKKFQKEIDAMYAKLATSSSERQALQQKAGTTQIRSKL